jgi:hypothetical protein
LALRNDNILLKTSTAMQENLDILKRISFENVEENRNLAQIAAQSQKDSQTLKALTIIATMYLPASLIAVSGSILSILTPIKIQMIANSFHYLDFIQLQSSATPDSKYGCYGLRSHCRVGVFLDLCRGYNHPDRRHLSVDIPFAEGVEELISPAGSHQGLITNIKIKKTRTFEVYSSLYI